MKCSTTRKYLITDNEHRLLGHWRLKNLVLQIFTRWKRTSCVGESNLWSLRYIACCPPLPRLIGKLKSPSNLHETYSTASASLANLVSLASSVISSISLPDPSEAGLFDTAPRPRQRSYRVLESEYTCVLRVFICLVFSFCLSGVSNMVTTPRRCIKYPPLSTLSAKWLSVGQVYYRYVNDLLMDFHRSKMSI